jgi:hypothetical protein
MAVGWSLPFLLLSKNAWVNWTNQGSSYVISSCTYTAWRSDFDNSSVFIRVGTVDQPVRDIGLDELQALIQPVIRTSGGGRIGEDLAVNSSTERFIPDVPAIRIQPYMPYWNEMT